MNIDQIFWALLPTGMAYIIALTAVWLHHRWELRQMHKRHKAEFERRFGTYRDPNIPS